MEVGLQDISQQGTNMEMLFWLLVGHAVADFSFQTDTMAKGKNRHNKTTPPVGQKYVPCWPYWLSAHAAIHGGAVALVTGSWVFGVGEFLAHWLTDFFKCENKYGVHTDQALHLAAKFLWVLLLT
jgi:hypothetical protein